MVITPKCIFNTTYAHFSVRHSSEAIWKRPLRTSVCVCVCTAASLVKVMMIRRCRRHSVVRQRHEKRRRQSVLGDHFTSSYALIRRNSSSRLPVRRTHHAQSVSHHCGKSSTAAATWEGPQGHTQVVERMEPFSLVISLVELDKLARKRFNFYRPQGFRQSQRSDCIFYANDKRKEAKNEYWTTARNVGERTEIGLIE